MPTDTRKVSIVRTTTVTIDDQQVKEAIRKHVNAPANADVEFECSYDYLSEARVKWSQEEPE